MVSIQEVGDDSLRIEFEVSYKKNLVKYSVTSNFKWKIFSNLVLFSKNSNFIRPLMKILPDNQQKI